MQKLWFSLEREVLSSEYCSVESQFASSKSNDYLFYIKQLCSSVLTRKISFKTVINSFFFYIKLLIVVCAKNKYNCRQKSKMGDTYECSWLDSFLIVFMILHTSLPFRPPFSVSRVHSNLDL